MVLHEFRCDEHLRFERLVSAGEAPPTARCPVCGAESPRLLSAPRIRRGSNMGMVAALNRAEESRFEPEVVTSLPGSGRTGRRADLDRNPAWRHLPRP